MLMHQKSQADSALSRQNMLPTLKMAPKPKMSDTEIGILDPRLQNLNQSINQLVTHQTKFIEKKKRKIKTNP